ncbi:hypothetical protein CCAL9344_07315 [Campylobacter sp. RM9344]|uniref:Uncharacterized protein n=1 Tax=Campylobacter californiensis TaxID=1032243 RepID=A0AAW3ZXG7_9BACT|nr:MULTISPECIES: hypothetical protein [unclassified Campylobacter]MBE2985115.1 hypothetical protein [Campylobacter sp. RM6883]MBE2986404.1 hypothetical protein [Campylobacter sp. RM12919]MBE2988724.1 hypothetical protein [Campylobacter sp. RM12920]MBE2995706.1 hypothetical protein [Campylobacter sp. RM6913]MBE3022803.1 hypothetical protein [Campylobacter sp. 7477a]MBE3029990.1 hypothetical protein [Campylobacter sp. RM9344]
MSENLLNLAQNFNHENENKILNLIAKGEFTDEEIKALLDLNKKDINIALSKHTNLKDEFIEILIENSVYMVVSNIIKFQNLNEKNREKLIDKVTKMPEFYKDVIRDLKEGKW